MPKPCGLRPNALVSFVPESIHPTTHPSTKSYSPSYSQPWFGAPTDLKVSGFVDSVDCYLSERIQNPEHSGNLANIPLGASSCSNNLVLEKSATGPPAFQDPADFPIWGRTKRGASQRRFRLSPGILAQPAELPLSPHARCYAKFGMAFWTGRCDNCFEISKIEPLTRHSLDWRLVRLQLVISWLWNKSVKFATRHLR